MKETVNSCEYIKQSFTAKKMNIQLQGWVNG